MIGLLFTLLRSLRVQLDADMHENVFGHPFSATQCDARFLSAIRDHGIGLASN
jgi:hypothetical protein